MKTLKTTLALAALTVTLFLAGTSSSHAGYYHNGYYHNGYYHSNAYYTHHGYYYRNGVYYHRGYWSHQNGVRVWINL